MSATYQIIKMYLAMRAPVVDTLLVPGGVGACRGWGYYHSATTITMLAKKLLSLP